MQKIPKIRYFLGGRLTVVLCPNIIKMDGNDYSNPLEIKADLRKNVAPIYGSARCAYFSNGAHFIPNQPEDFTFTLEGGFSFIGVIQPEGDDEYIITGTKSAINSCLIIYFNADKVKNRIKVELRDDDGKALIGFTQLNPLAAKGIMVNIDTINASIQIYEINLCELPIERNIDYLIRESPVKFNSIKHIFRIASCDYQGTAIGTYKGKIGITGYYLRSIKQEQINGLLKPLIDEIIKFHKKVIKYRPVNEELHYLFLDDYLRLKHLLLKAEFTTSDARETSTILYRWLLDKEDAPKKRNYDNRILVNICIELGIQLTFPGLSESGKEMLNKLKLWQPDFSATNILGRESLSGYKWVLIDEFLNDYTFIIKDHAVSIESLIKFVRNKLGGGHFDSVDRKKWQSLLGNDFYKTPNHFIVGTLRQIVIAVFEALDECRVMEHIVKPEKEFINANIEML